MRNLGDKAPDPKDDEGALRVFYVKGSMAIACILSRRDSHTILIINCGCVMEKIAVSVQVSYPYHKRYVVI